MKKNDGIQDSFAGDNGRSQSVATGGSGINESLDENLVEETIDDGQDEQLDDKN